MTIGQRSLVFLCVVICLHYFQEKRDKCLFTDQEGLHGDIVDKIRCRVGKESRVPRSRCYLSMRRR